MSRGMTGEVMAPYNSNRVTRKKEMSMSSKPKGNRSTGPRATTTKAADTGEASVGNAARDEEDVLEYCEKEKMGFIPWFPLAAGRVSSSESPISRIAARWKATPSQVALAWLLARSPVILPIPGTSRVEHLEENVAAAELKIDAKKWQGLDRMARAG